MKYIFMVEERSMSEFLEIFLDNNSKITKEKRRIIPHSGKSDLKKSLPIKLRALNEPNTLFIVLIDQDSSDCKELKADITRICGQVKNARCIVRIVCRELESWYLGDLEAVDSVFNTKLSKHEKRKSFRMPDMIPNPKQILFNYIKPRGQVNIAQRMADAMTQISIHANRSKSFDIFLQTIREIE
jgi:hypothetical protein